MTMLFERDNGADQGRHQNLLQEKNLHSKKLICVWWDMEGIYTSSYGPTKPYIQKFTVKNWTE
jgi:hypothetical protein